MYNAGDASKGVLCSEVIVAETVDVCIDVMVTMLMLFYVGDIVCSRRSDDEDMSKSLSERVLENQGDYSFQKIKPTELTPIQESTLVQGKLTSYCATSPAVLRLAP